MINAEEMLQSDKTLEKGNVLGRCVTLEGFIISSCDENLKLNSIVHKVEFSNGQVKGHDSNKIAENMLKIFFLELFLLMLIDSIVDCKK